MFLGLLGVLPKDAASIGSLTVTAAATAAAVAASGDEAAEPDAVVLATRSRRVHHQQQQAMSDLICGKPGPLASHFMAQKGLQPPSIWQQRLVGPLAAKAPPKAMSSVVRSTGVDAAAGEAGSAQLDACDSSSSSNNRIGGSNAKAVATACLKEAAAVVDKYKHSKRATAATQKKSLSALHQDQRLLEQQKQVVCRQARKRQDVSNAISSNTGQGV
jgi:hypothetical protein